MEAGDRQRRDAGEDIGKPGFGVYVIQPCGDDESEHDGRPVGAMIGTGKEPGFPAAGNAPFILPMSAMKSRYITAGIRISARGFPFAA